MAAGHSQVKLLTAFLLIILFAGCGGGSASVKASRTPTPSPSPSLLDLHPELVIKGPGDGYFAKWRPSGVGRCRGVGGYSDLHRNAGITLYAPDGDVAGTGFITNSYPDGNKECVMIGTVSNALPERFYDVQFANRNRIAFSREEIVSGSADTVIR